MSRPAWHVVVALAGAVVISMAGEAGQAARRTSDVADSSETQAAIAN